MQKVAFVLVCMAYSCLGRRVKSSIESLKLVDTDASSQPLDELTQLQRHGHTEFNPSQSLAMLLLADNAAPAFNPAGPGTRIPSHAASKPDALNRQSLSARISAPRTLSAAHTMAEGDVELDGKEVRVGIVKARQHEEIADELLAGVKEALSKCGVDSDNIVEYEVPSTFELPLASRFLALSRTVDVILPVGVLIKEDAVDFAVKAEIVSAALMNIGLQSNLPVIFSVLTAETEAQAKERSSGESGQGLEWGKAAVEMALLRQQAAGQGKKSFLGFLGGDEESKEGKEGDDEKKEKKKITF